MATKTKNKIRLFWPIAPPRGFSPPTRAGPWGDSDSDDDHHGLIAAGALVGVGALGFFYMLRKRKAQGQAARPAPAGSVFPVQTVGVRLQPEAIPNR